MASYLCNFCGPKTRERGCLLQSGVESSSWLCTLEQLLQGLSSSLYSAYHQPLIFP